VHERLPLLEETFARANLMSFLMTNFLPAVLWKPSPNFSSRCGTRVDLIVLHDCEGGYEGSIQWFEMSGSKFELNRPGLIGGCFV
jgi:hypothetical protein